LYVDECDISMDILKTNLNIIEKHEQNIKNIDEYIANYNNFYNIYLKYIGVNNKEYEMYKYINKEEYKMYENILNKYKKNINYGYNLTKNS
jgi:hypothetical protein